MTEKLNDLFFAGCSLSKLSSPIEWIQMPWIRPEDVDVYSSEGIKNFKLSDRLATTNTLLKIAKAYLSKTTPDNLFEIIERDGKKYNDLIFGAKNDIEKTLSPMHVASNKIPKIFIEHFVKGSCNSRNIECSICQNVTVQAVKINNDFIPQKDLFGYSDKLPNNLLDRIRHPQKVFQ